MPVQGVRDAVAIAAVAVAIASAAAIAVAGATYAQDELPLGMPPAAHAQEAGPCGDDSSCTQVDVGALLLRGDAFDEQRWIAFGAAVERFNAMQEDADPRIALSLSRHDLEHGQAATAVSAAHDGGAGPMYYLGPTFSGNLLDASEYVRDNGLVAVSPSSSASSLAVPGDGVYRMTPPVDREAGVLARLVASASISTIVPAVQSGEFGSSTLDAVGRALNGSGVQVGEAVRFEPGNMSSWRSALASLNATLGGMQEGGSAGDAGVLLVIGFEEDFGTMAGAAADYSAATAARWFVPSGALYPSLNLTGAALDAATAARVTTLVVEDAPDGAAARAYMDEAIAAAGMNSTTYDYSAHDSVFVLGRAAGLAAAGGADVTSAEGAAAVRSSMQAAARLHTGALGDVRLDAAGDLRSPVSYAVWGMNASGNWTKSGSEGADGPFCPPPPPEEGGACMQVSALVSVDPPAFGDDLKLEAIRLGVDDHNAEQAARGSEAVYLDLSVRDVRPGSALDAVRAEHAGGSGPSLYIGPTTSPDLESVTGYAAGNGLVVVSPSSSAASLAAQDDAVFRMTAPSYLEAPALARVLAADSVGTVATLTQGDGFGRPLLAVVSRALGNAGIEVAGGAEYDPADPSGWPAALEALGAAAAAGNGSDAILFVGGFDANFTAVAGAAAGAGGLDAYRWYSTSSVITDVSSPLPDPDARRLAEAVNLTAMAIDESGSGESRRVDAALALGAGASIYEYGAYDAARVIGRAAADAAASAEDAGAAGIARSIPGAAASYSGALGDVRLNAAGDLRSPVSYTAWTADAASASGWSRAASVQADGSLCVNGTVRGTACTPVGILLSVDPPARGNDATLLAVQLGIDDHNDRMYAAAGDSPAAYLDPVVRNVVPGGALDAVRAAHAGGSGPDYYVGLPFSQDVAAAKPYVDENGLVLVSPLSSSSALAVPGDGIFRLEGPNYREAPPFARLLLGDGIGSAVVLVAQDDAWGRPLAADIGAALEAEGIAVAVGARLNGTAAGGYDDAGDWDAPMRDLAAAVSAAVQAAPGGGSNATAVVFVGGFAVDFEAAMTAAAGHDALGTVRWYATEALLDVRRDLGAGSAAGMFERTVNFTEVSAAVAYNDATARIDRIIDARLGAGPGQGHHEHDYNAYDSARVLGAAVAAAAAATAAGGGDGGTAVDAESVKRWLPHAARSYSGALGDISLDAAGDLRSPLAYDAWTVAQNGTWYKRATLAADDAACAGSPAGPPNCVELGVIAAGGAAAEQDDAVLMAVRLAIDEHNAGYAAQSGTYIEPRIVRAGPGDDGLLDAMRAAHANGSGPSAYAGTLPDGDTGAIRAFAAGSGLLVFAASSGEPQLSVHGDGVDRQTASSHGHTARAAAWAMSSDGVRAAVVIDAGGDGQAAAVSGAAGALGISVLGVFDLSQGVAGAAAAAAADRAAPADAGNATAVVVAGGSAADLEALAAASAGSDALRSARWYFVDTGGYAASGAAGPALASLANATDVTAVHAPYGGNDAAARVDYAAGTAAGAAAGPAPFLLYSAYDAARLAADAAAAASASQEDGGGMPSQADARRAAAAYSGALGNFTLDAAGNLAPPSPQLSRSAPAQPGAAWSAPVAAPAPEVCSAYLEMPKLDFGNMRAGGASQALRQTLVNNGTAPLGVSVEATGWTATAGGATEVLPASFTELAAAGQSFTPLRAAPQAVAVAGAADPGASIGIDYRLNLAGAAPAIASDTPVSQTITYVVRCPS